MKTRLTVKTPKLSKQQHKLLLGDLVADIVAVADHYQVNGSTQKNTLTVNCDGLQAMPLGTEINTTDLGDLVASRINRLTCEESHRHISRILSESTLYIDGEEFIPKPPPLPDRIFGYESRTPKELCASGEANQPENLQFEMPITHIIGALNIHSSKRQVMIDETPVHFPHGASHKACFEALLSVRATLSRTANRRKRLLLDRQDMIAALKALIQEFEGCQDPEDQD